MNNFIQFLTYFRIIAGPIIFILIVISNFYGLAFILFVLASLSDYWDGYLARKYQLVSVMGEVLDPIADKILITFVIIALAISLESSFIAFIGSIILSREFWVAALRDFNARNGNINATKAPGRTGSMLLLVWKTGSNTFFCLRTMPDIAPGNDGRYRSRRCQPKPAGSLARAPFIFVGHVTNLRKDS